LPEPGTEVASPSPASTPSTSPTQSTKTLNYRVAESPDDLKNAAFAPYTSHPMNIQYVFRDSTPGKKVLYVQFRNNLNGVTTPVNASIELIEDTSSLPETVPASVNLLPDNMINTTLSVSQKVYRVSDALGSSTYKLTGKIVDGTGQPTNGGVIQVDEYDENNNYVTSYSSDKDFNVAEGHYIYVVVRAAFGTVTFSDIKLLRSAPGGITPVYLPDSITNVTLKSAQKVFQVNAAGSYRLSGKVDATGSIQFDEYDKFDNYIKTHPNNSEFTIPEGHYGYAIIRAENGVNVKFSDVSLIRIEKRTSSSVKK
jgi:hypothetical protein